MDGRGDSEEDGTRVRKGCHGRWRGWRLGKGGAMEGRKGL